MTIRYVSKSRGSDSFEGTEARPWATIGVAIKAVVPADEVIIEEGIYHEGGWDTDLGTDNVAFKGKGRVIVDASGYADIYAGVDTCHYITWDNVTFKNPSRYFFAPGNNSLWYFSNCSFILDGACYQKSLSTYFAHEMYGSFSNCLLYGLRYTRLLGASWLMYESCAFINCYSVTSEGIYVNCAGNISAIYDGPGGVNSDTYPPPFTDISDPANPNLTYDETKLNYDMYMSGGSDLSILGTRGTAGISWPKHSETGSYEPGRFSHLGSTSYRGHGAWANYADSYDEAWEDLDISPGNANNTFQFDEGSGPKTATIGTLLYTDGITFAAAVATAITNAAPVDSHTITFESFGRLSWSSSGSSLTLNTNTYSTDPAWEAMGFDIDADKTGQAAYESDHSLCVGPGPSADPDVVSIAGPIIVNAETGMTNINLGAEPWANNGDVVSPLMSNYFPKKLKSLSIARTTNGTGEIDSERLSTTRKGFVRGSNVLFDMQAPSGSTALDWTEVELDNADLSAVLTVGFKHWQVRLRLRTNATL